MCRVGKIQFLFVSVGLGGLGCFYGNYVSLDILVCTIIPSLMVGRDQLHIAAEILTLCWTQLFHL